MSTARQAVPRQRTLTLLLPNRAPGLCTCKPLRIVTGGGRQEWAIHADWCAVPEERHQEQLR